MSTVVDMRVASHPLDLWDTSAIFSGVPCFSMVSLHTAAHSHCRHILISSLTGSYLSLDSDYRRHHHLQASTLILLSLSGNHRANGQSPQPHLPGWREECRYLFSACIHFEFLTVLKKLWHLGLEKWLSGGCSW